MSHNILFRLAVVAGLLLVPAITKAGNALPFEGRWAADDKSLCSTKTNPTGEGIHTLTNRTYTSYETSCKVVTRRDLTPTTYTITLHCASEAEMGDSVLNIAVKSPATAQVTWGTPGKDAQTYFRCQ